MIPVLLFWAALQGVVRIAPPVVSQQRTIEAELRSLRHRGERILPGTPEAQALSRDLTSVGRLLLAQREAGHAVEVFSEALGWDAENGLALAALTLAYLREGNFEFARFYLRLAEERSVNAPAEAYQVLGEVYTGLNRLEDAVTAWEHYRRLGGQDGDVLARLGQARQELSLTTGQRVLFEDEFTLYYDRALPEATVLQIGEHLKKGRSELAKFFKMGLAHPQVVILYAGRSYFSLVSVPDWVSGIFDGKLRIALEPDSGVTDELTAVLSHELAHALLREATRDRAPAWLHEGLAQWWEGKRIALAEIRETFSGRSPYSLTEIEENLSHRAERTVARTSYVQSLGLIEYLTERHGDGSLSCLVRDLAEGHSLAEALWRQTGLSPQEFLSRWKAWAKL